MIAVRIYSRPPLPGATKTRLASAIGATNAAALHRAFLEDVIAHARAIPDATITLDVTEDHPSLRELAVRHGLALVVQAPSDLGGRMSASLADALQGAGRVLIVGSDAPLLGTAALAHAARSLDEADVVFAPTPDGGYALIGARRAFALAGIRASTPHALADSEAAARAAGLLARRLSPTLDVDVLDDLRLLRAALAVEPGLAPATARALAAMDASPL